MGAVKKIFNVLLIILGVVLIIVCVDLISNKTVKTSFDSLDEVDRGAVEELCKMTVLFDDKDGCPDVWDGDYNLRGESIIITRKFASVKGYTYAVNMDLSQNIFASKIVMPEKYASVSVYRFAYFTPFTFEALGEDGGFTDINGRSVYITSFDKQKVDQNGAGSLEEAYVKNTFAASVESLDVPSPDVTTRFEISEENVALTGLQMRILDDMIAAKDPSELDELICEFTAVREYQNEKFPAFAKARVEKELEGGCTQYAFYNISSLIGHEITYFNKEKADAITFYSAYYYLCTGKYNGDIGEFLDVGCHEYIGAALCSVLDSSNIIPDWKNRLCGKNGEDFTAQYTLIKEYSDRECGEFADKTIDDIKEIYNYAEITNMAKALIQAQGK